jgi:hypothetical protein
MIDDFLVDDNDYNDDDEYFTAVSNETCISYSSCTCSCSSVTASEYTQLSATTYNQDIESEYESLNNTNNTNNIYSSIFFYLSFFDFTKYFN